VIKVEIFSRATLHALALVPHRYAILTSCGITRDWRSPGAPRGAADAGTHSCQPGGGGGQLGSGCHSSAGTQPGGGRGQPGGGLSRHWPTSGIGTHEGAGL
jgi:hypothetical protein